MQNPSIRARRDMLYQVAVFPEWLLLGLLVVLTDPVISINPILGAGMGVVILFINIVNTIRVVAFIRRGYHEASKNDQFLQTLNIPIRTVPVVLAIGSAALVLYLTYTLLTLATLVKDFFWGPVSALLVILAVLQFVILAPLYFVMAGKLTAINKSRGNS